MNYISLCDGIGAAHLAFDSLGWKCVGVSEIDPMCNAVVNRHWNFTNFGDLTDERTINHISDARPDIIIGGTPCTSFSIAGKQRGIKDDNGQLILWFLHAVFRAKPDYFVWENVPNVRAIDKGAVFKAFLASLAEIGYCVQWRVLDAQYFGVPQRRERVFVCGHKRNGRGPQILFESEAISGDITQGEKTKQINQRTVARCLTAGCRKDDRGEDGNLIVSTVTSKWSKGSCGPAGDECQNITTTGTLTSALNKGGTLQDARANLPIAQTITAGCRNIAKAGNNVGVVNPVIEEMGVRRLTPTECEALQGFPKNYTLVPLRTTKAGKVIMTSDSARYRMIGNSMAVPVIRWIGERIKEHDANTR